MKGAKFQKGDIIGKEDPNWGNTTLMVADIKTVTDTFPDDLDVYQLIVLESPHRMGGTIIELSAWMVDKAYRHK
jgi:hypothetical protein